MAHPKDRPRPIDRRAFLQRAAAAGIALPSMAAILAACGDSGSSGGDASASAALQLARPDNPVTLPITDDNPAIADGLDPEAGPLKIFGYNDYIWKKVRNGFGDQYGVDVEYTVFDTPDEMVAKMQSNGADFDLVVTVTLENVGKLAQGGPDPAAQQDLPAHVDRPAVAGRSRTSTTWAASTRCRTWSSPPASRGATTRSPTTSARMDNPYDIFWDPTYKGQAHLLNGSRDTLGGGAAARGLRPERRATRRSWTQVKQDLLDGADAMGWKYDHVDYTELSTNLWQVHDTWSGQMVYYQYYLPKGLDITALSYAWPPQGPGEDRRA